MLYVYFRKMYIYFDVHKHNFWRNKINFNSDMNEHQKSRVICWNIQILYLKCLYCFSLGGHKFTYLSDVLWEQFDIEKKASYTLRSGQHLI